MTIGKRLRVGGLVAFLIIVLVWYLDAPLAPELLQAFFPGKLALLGLIAAIAAFQYRTLQDRVFFAFDHLDDAQLCAAFIASSGTRRKVTAHGGSCRSPRK